MTKIPPDQTLTREELLRARGEPPTPAASIETPDTPGPATDSAPRRCRHCGRPLPARRRVVCSDECAAVDDRQRARERHRANAKRRNSTANGQHPGPAPAAQPPTVVAVLAELLTLPAVGAVELEVDGARILVTPR